MAEKEYIERETIEKAFAEEIRTNYLDDYAKGFQAALLAIMSIPSADVAPVRHGHWIECNYGLTFECSECKYPTEYNLTDYCPNCDAKMDGDKNGRIQRR